LLKYGGDKQQDNHFEKQKKIVRNTLKKGTKETQGAGTLVRTTRTDPVENIYFLHSEFKSSEARNFEFHLAN